MRKDIEIRALTGDINLVSTREFNCYSFRWVSNPAGLSRYIYGEVDIPATIDEETVRQEGFDIRIPYTPKYKEFMIRVRRKFSDDTYEYVRNLADGSEWFVVTAGLYGKDVKNMYASQLALVNDEYSYYIKLDNKTARLYSSYISDVNIVPADNQNCNFLLECHPANNYRYPLTGVGLSNWVNSTGTNNAALAEAIDREFREDGVIPRNVRYNYETSDLEIELDPINK